MYKLFFNSHTKHSEARGIAAEPPADMKRSEMAVGDGADSPTQATKREARGSAAARPNHLINNKSGINTCKKRKNAYYCGLERLVCFLTYKFGTHNENRN
jgi:hypothetical protein